MDQETVAVIQRVAIFMPTFLFALVFHEYAHARVALHFGDRTSEWSGRLTLNPIVHLDLFGTLFPLIGIITGSSYVFGWAKPVPINPREFNNYRKGLFWVAFAGPLANIFLGFVTAFAYVAFVKYVPRDASFHDAGSSMLQSFLGINFMLAIFNLIPLPPLDGSNMLLSFLSYEATRKFYVVQQYSFMIMLFLMFSGAFRIIQFPIMLLMELSVSLAAFVFGLS